MSVNSSLGKSAPTATPRTGLSHAGARAFSRKARRVGRPSIADDRRAQIVEAFLECIRRHGLAGATMERVAEALGISRTLVFHYFGDSEALTRAATEKIFEQTLHRLSTSVVALPTTERGRAMLDFIFAGPHFGELRDVIVMAEVTSLAGRDKRVQAMLADMWERSIGIVADELCGAFPHADPSRCRAIAYALTCLAEENWWMTFIGPGVRYRSAAREAAETLLGSLHTAAEMHDLDRKPSKTNRGRKKPAL